MSDAVIAIDGPAAAGKSTVAALLAQKLEVPYVNTGNMYRAVALAAKRAGVRLDPFDEGEIARLLEHTDISYEKDRSGSFALKLNGRFESDALREADMAQLASRISALKVVRDFMLDEQRKFGQDGNLVVMEGRDIGTVIFPGARYKFFVTASSVERARRRLAQGKESPGATLEEVAKEIALRDEQDSSRAIAPLRAAADALVVDTSDMTIEEVVDTLVERIEK